MKRKFKLPQLALRADLAPESIDSEKRTVKMVWTVGERVLRENFWTGERFWEELSLEDGHVRMDRLASGRAPFLANHSRWGLSDVIGVIEEATVDRAKGEATVRFADTPDVADAWRKVETGILRNVSVGYKIHKVERIAPAEGEKYPTYRAVDWEPVEISLVPIGADSAAAIRSEEERAGQEFECEFINQFAGESGEEGRSMKKDVNQEGQTPNAPAPAAVQVDIEQERRVAEEAGAKKERQRCLEIRDACRAAKLEDKDAEKMISDGVSIEQARKLIIDMWAERGAPAVVNAVRVEAGEQDERQTRRDGMEQALLHRFDSRRYEMTEKGRIYRGMTLARMAEEVVGRDARGMPGSEIAARALATSDFPLILGNVASKTLRDAYQVQGRTFTPFVREGRLPDYKEVSRVQLGDAPSLEEVGENGEYTYGSIGEAAERIKLVKRGKLIAITEETIVNDDLDAFSRIPQMLGAAAARAESKEIYNGTMIGNPNMADGKALFHADHGNLLTAATILAGLDKAKAAMRKQKTLDGEDFLELEPAFLIVGPDKETEAKQILSSLILAGKAADVNVHSNSMQLIVESRITGNKWFVAANPSQVDTIEIAYLDGMAGPQIDTKYHFERDAVVVKIKHVFGVKAIDWRGLAYNPGA